MNGLIFSRDDLIDGAERVLALNPDPVPRFRLIGDVLHTDSENIVYLEAHERLRESRWIAKLEGSQQSDGTWGRFHTQDTKVKQVFPTTETAVRVALDSGLDQGSPVLARLKPTLLDYTSGAISWPDWPEKHDNPAAWPIWVRHYSAAVLGSIDPLNPILDEFWHIRAQSVREAFESGEYDRKREIEVLNDLLDCRMKNPVPYDVTPSLLVLSSSRNRLPADLETRVLDNVTTSDRGIYYTHAANLSLFPNLEQRWFWSWLRAHKILSRFDLWPSVCSDAINWIWEQRLDDGLWDTDTKVSRKPFSSFPLSESWRRRENRRIDFSTEVLTLLSAITRPQEA